MQESQLNNIFELNKAAFKEAGFKISSWKKLNLDEKIEAYEDVSDRYELVTEAVKSTPKKVEEEKKEATLSQLFNRHFNADYVKSRSKPIYELCADKGYIVSVDDIKQIISRDMHEFVEQVPVSAAKKAVEKYGCLKAYFEYCKASDMELNPRSCRKYSQFEEEAYPLLLSAVIFKIDKILNKLAGTEKSKGLFQKVYDSQFEADKPKKKAAKKNAEIPDDDDDVISIKSATKKKTKKVNSDEEASMSSAKSKGSTKKSSATKAKKQDSDSDDKPTITRTKKSKKEISSDEEPIRQKGKKSKQPIESDHDLEEPYESDAYSE